MLVDTGSDGLHGHLDLSEANLFLKRQKTWIFCSIPWVCISAECQKVIDIKKEIFIDFWSAFCSTGCKNNFDRLEYTTSSFLCIEILGHCTLQSHTQWQRQVSKPVLQQKSTLLDENSRKEDFTSLSKKKKNTKAASKKRIKGEFYVSLVQKLHFNFAKYEWHLENLKCLNLWGITIFLVEKIVNERLLTVLVWLQN